MSTKYAYCLLLPFSRFILLGNIVRKRVETEEAKNFLASGWAFRKKTVIKSTSSQKQPSKTCISSTKPKNIMKTHSTDKNQKSQSLPGVCPPSPVKRSHRLTSGSTCSVSQDNEDVSASGYSITGSQDELVIVNFSPSRTASPKKAGGKGFFGKLRGTINKKQASSNGPLQDLSSGAMNATFSAGGGLLCNTETQELIDMIQDALDEHMAHEEKLTETIEKEQRLAKARYLNGSENVAMISMKKARNLMQERTRVTTAIDMGMDAIDDLSVKMERAKEKSRRNNKRNKKNKKDDENTAFFVDVGRHANVLQQMEEILSGDTDDESVNNEDMAEQLREL